MGLLITEIFILICFATAYNLSEKKADIFDRVINTAFIVIAAGIPLIFTSITRSVFEVTKLLALRLTIVTVAAAWFSKQIVYNLRANAPAETTGPDGRKMFKLFFLRWEKTGLEYPILAWIIINIFSTLFSPNRIIAYIGAYDRWEGILLVLNYITFFYLYISLVRSAKIFNWILFALISTAALSSIYGFFQSLGMDFMRWSVDPTARVFACINNPVHFSAYVAMLTPVSIGWFLQRLEFKREHQPETPAEDGKRSPSEKQTLITRCKTLLAKYFLRPVTGNGKKELNIANIVLLLIFISFLLIYYAVYLSYGRGTWVGFSSGMTIFLLLMTRSFSFEKLRTAITDGLLTLFAMGAWQLIFPFRFYRRWPILILISSLVLLAYFLISYFKLNKDLKKSLAKILIIVQCSLLPSIAGFWSHSFFFLLLGIGWFLLTEVRYRKILYAFNFLILIIVFIPSLLLPAITAERVKLHQTQTAKHKFQQLQKEAFTGSARTSMWRTGLSMFKDHPIFGMGPGTIKEMYPEYRKSDYGRLEGGQNYTPDKLHNEYVNTLATRGITGVLTYYFWFLPLCFIIIFRRLQGNDFTPTMYLLIGLVSGFFIYLSQVLFNFGVVATKVLFYELLALAVAIALHNPWKDLPEG